jgi:hypothetical protein
MIGGDVLLEKLTVTHLAKESPGFYETQILLSVFSCAFREPDESSCKYIE